MEEMSVEDIMSEIPTEDLPCIPEVMYEMELGKKEVIMANKTITGPCCWKTSILLSLP
jgi:hypothetical protein